MSDGNTINIQVEGDENVSKTFAKVQGSAKETERVIVDSTASSSDAFDTATRRSGAFGKALDMTAGAGDALGQGMDQLGSGIQAVTDLQTLGARKSDEHKRALVELEQATNDAEQADIDLSQAMNDADQATVDLRQSTNDLKQAQIDGKQATLDVAQAEIDKKQAVQDAAQAQEDYNTAVKEHGARSKEAQQATIDLQQAQQDLKQANLDSEQATADAAQAEIDAAQATTDNKQATIDQRQAKADQTQATIDAKNAQLDYNEAQRNLQSMAGPLGEFTSYMTALSPVIMGVVGAIDLMKVAQAALTAETVTSTAAQVGSRIAIIASAVATGVATAATIAWDVALTIATAPITLIIVAVALLVGGIIYLATQTQFFQKTWDAIWGAIGDPVKKAGKWISEQWDKDTKAWSDMFHRVINTVTGMPGQIADGLRKAGSFISAPFRAEFNAIAWAWNSTVGRLHFTLPSWIPGLGGSGFSMPTIPKLDVGGDVMRTGAAIVHSGERVSTAKQTSTMDAFIAAASQLLTGSGSLTSGGGNRLTVELRPSPGFDSELLRVLLSMISVAVAQTGGNFDDMIRTTQ